MERGLVVLRGEVWWASLPEPSGSGPGFRRPLLIVQSDSFNKSRIRTIVAVVISSNLGLSKAPGNLMLKRGRSKLPKDSIINVSQIITVDRRFLTEKIRKLDSRFMQDVDAGLRLVLSL